MQLVLLATMTAFSVMALGFSIVSLLFHWKRPKETQGAVAELAARVTAIQGEQLDMLDKVETWIKRDRVRNARGGKKPPQATNEHEDELPAVESKEQLRKRVYSNLSAITGGRQ